MGILSGKKEVKKDFSCSECLALINISNIRNSDDLTWSMICGKAGVYCSHPVYRRVFNFLIAEGIITVRHTSGACKFLKIDHGALCDLIDEQEHITFIAERYLAVRHIFSW